MADFKGKLSQGSMHFTGVSLMPSCPLLHFVFLSSLKVSTPPHIQKIIVELKLRSDWFNSTLL